MFLSRSPSSSIAAHFESKRGLLDGASEGPRAAGRRRCHRPVSACRCVLTPNDFRSLAAVKDRLLRVQARYEATATPFQWTFTRRDLHRLLAKLADRPRRLAA